MATFSCRYSERVLIERIVAPNPGPMTLTGTNTYLVGDGSGQLAVIDPGPDDTPSHLEAIIAAAARLGSITSVIATHRHLDHMPAAALLCTRTGAPLVGHRDLPGVQRAVLDGEFAFGGLLALETPGHTRESICLWNAQASALFTGDLVLGTGSAVLDDAPGALSDYLGSLSRLLALGPSRLYPGHGPIVEDGVARLTEYIEHRRLRLEQVIAALRSNGVSSADELAVAIYTDTPRNLLPMAARNVRANLDLLFAERRVERIGAEQWRLTK
jgi:glyoxylase-like metal-dependent hydrolase (beta-lactamase superfamily II)